MIVGRRYSLKFLKGIREIVSFLTIFPTGENRLEEAPYYMFVFPLVGILIGALAGILGLAFFRFFPNLISGAFTLSIIFIITGLHHIDGLTDFGDGLMIFGSSEEKIEAMRDESIGVGGLIIGLLTVLITIFGISNLGEKILISLIICEVSAKLSMVFGAKISKSAKKGSNTLFIEKMKGRYGTAQLILAVIISIILAIWLFGINGILPILGGVLTSIVLVLISRKKFNGITGDVFGAMNEISRMTGLIILLTI